MQFDHPTVQGAIDRVAAAAAKAGKWWGIPSGTTEAAQAALGRDARMVVCGVDHVFLVRGFENAFKEFGQLTLSQTNRTSRLLGSEL